MVQFGERLGCANSVISRYESGLLTPSRSMLLLIYRLAETPAEKAAIEATLGGAPDVLEPKITDADAALRAALRDLQQKEKDDLASRTIWERLAEQFSALTDRAEVPLWLVEALHLWLLYRDLPASQREFDAAYLALSRRLELLAPLPARAAELDRPMILPEVEGIQHGRRVQAEIQEFRVLHPETPVVRRKSVFFAKRDSRYSSVPLRMMAVCPQEKRPYWTGSVISQKNFERGDIRGLQAACAHCGSTHILNKQDVYLELPTT